MTKYWMSENDVKALYDDNTPVGVHRALCKRAESRISYILEFLIEHYFDGNGDDVDLVYDNSSSYLYEIYDYHADDGHFDPVRYKNNIFLVQNNDNDCPMPEKVFKYITIKKYSVEISIEALTENFETDILEYLKEHDPSEEQKLTESKLREMYNADLGRIPGEFDYLVSSYISFESWKLANRY